MKVYIPKIQFTFLTTSAASSLLVLGMLYVSIAQNWFVLNREQPNSTVETFLSRGRVKPLFKREIALHPSAPDMPTMSIPSSQLARIQAAKRDLKLNYGVTVRVFNAESLQEFYGVTATPYNPRALERILQYLDQWLAVYPKEYLQTIGINTIYVFETWEYEMVKTSGFHLDTGVIGISAQEKVLHHELWHVADYNTFGEAGDNEQWNLAKFLSKTSPYASNEGLEAIHDDHYRGKRPIGFATEYGKFGGPDEDQATTAALLLTNYRSARSFMEKDATFAAGVEYLKLFFLQHSSGLMNEQYWQQLEQKQYRNTGYLQSTLQSLANLIANSCEDCYSTLLQN